MKMSDSANKTRALRCRENIRLQDSMQTGQEALARGPGAAAGEEVGRHRFCQEGEEGYACLGHGRF